MDCENVSINNNNKSKTDCAKTVNSKVGKKI